MTSRATLCTEGKAAQWRLTELEAARVVDGLHAMPGNHSSGDDMNSTGAIDAASPRHRQEARRCGGRRSGGAKVIRCLMARSVGHGEIVAYLDALFEALQQAVATIVKAVMELRKPAPGDPSIKVQVFMPASVYQRLREHADRTGSGISRLCRDGALRELECAPSPAPAALP